LLGKEYERIRTRMPAGSRRTILMNALVARAQQLGPARGGGRIGEQLFSEGSDGARIAGLSLARLEPQRGHVEMVLEGIGKSRSAFEQFHALRLYESIFSQLDPTARERVQVVINSQINITITPDDLSRWTLARQFLAPVSKPSSATWRVEPQMVTEVIQDLPWRFVEVRPV